MTDNETAKELDSMTDRELVAIWNVMTTGLRMVGSDKNHNQRILKLTKPILNKRGINTVNSKRIKRV